MFMTKLLTENQEQILMDVLTLSQPELHEYVKSFLLSFYPKEKMFEQQGEGIYFAGDIPVLLVAHMDTVHQVQPTLNNIYYDQEKQAMWSPSGIGADCRAGIFNILATVAKGYLPHIMVTWDEEIGGVGAGKLMNRWGEKSFSAEAILVQEYMGEVNFAIQYDRHGFGEAVYYYLDNKDFENYISGFGYHTQIGSYTDICEICPTFGFAGVNVAAGYVSEHTKQEILHVDEMMSTHQKVINILNDQIENPQFFEYKEAPYKYYGSQSWANNSAYGYNWDEVEDDMWTGTSSRKDVAYGEHWYDEASDLSFDSSVSKKTSGFEKPEKCFCCDAKIEEGENWSDSIDDYQSLSCFNCRIKYYETAADVPESFLVESK